MCKTEKDKIEQEFAMLDELEKLEVFEDSHLSVLVSLALSHSSEVRMRVAEVLGSTEPKKAENILLKLLDDEDQLVRVNACDSLCICSSEQVMAALFEKAKTDSFLVRGYSILSIVDVAKNGEYDYTYIYDKLKNIFDKEKSVWVRISYFYSFNMLGYHEYFESLLNAVNSFSYRNRCFALNLLEDVINENNAETTKKSLLARMKIEKTNAVISNIKELLYNTEKLIKKKI